MPKQDYKAFPLNNTSVEMKLDKALISTEEILRKRYEHKKVVSNRCGHTMEFHPKAQNVDKFCPAETNKTTRSTA